MGAFDHIDTWQYSLVKCTCYACQSLGITSFIHMVCLMAKPDGS